jgi:hypothetical protein
MNQSDLAHQAYKILKESSADILAAQIQSAKAHREGNERAPHRRQADSPPGRHHAEQAKIHREIAAEHRKAVMLSSKTSDSRRTKDHQDLADYHESQAAKHQSKV